ncbi:hypothetical protein SLEP1_g15649 [Rubroshorea leprosula]|uniref:Uncharacterized protein n=1 Tax=Rubroshorea leprosula TaxID=152421 RepID=A0AAV5ISA4_9ROSI|nr:hypothetical protein SLEP1_g15649 [Rubroshorea leprosula]
MINPAHFQFLRFFLKQLREAAATCEALIILPSLNVSR